MEIKNIAQVDFSKVNRKVILIVPAQSAKLGPPVGPILGQVKIKVKDFCTAFNDITNIYPTGFPVRVVVFVYKGESFDFIIKSPSVSFLIKNILEFKSKDTVSLLDLYKIMLIKHKEEEHILDFLLFRNILAITKHMNIKIN
jgi:ribosomal protein L11